MRSFILLALWALAPGGIPLGASPLTFGTVPGFDPAEYRVTTFASGLGFTFALTRDHTGAILAGVGGQVLRFTDANNDGVADGSGIPVVSSNPTYLTDLDRVGDYLVVSAIVGSTSQIQFYRPGADPNDPYALAGTLTIQLTSDWSHLSPGTAIRPTPG